VRRAKSPGANQPRRRAGFALLAVIWGVGLIATMVVAFMSTGRLRLQTAMNIASATEAGYIAESAINIAMLPLLSRKDATPTPGGETEVQDGAPRFCVLDRAAVALSIEEEGGKIDINAAPAELLATVVAALGADASAAPNIAKAIIDFRTTPDGLGPVRETPVSAKPVPLKQAPFATVMELDQVNGIEPDLFRALIPFVTVHSRSPGVDPRAAPPALFAALSGSPPDEVRRLSATPFPNSLNRLDPRFPQALRQMSEHGAYLIHAEALLATGQTAVREALVDMRPVTGQPFAIREMRRGPSRYTAALREMIARNGAGVADC
jgi:general secretion pathway protein K